MTNQEIISNEIITNKLMTKEELEKYIEENLELPKYLTFAQWQRLGYKIIKGQKAIIKTKLWKKITKKIDKTKELNNENSTEEFYLVNASLFAENQVEKIKEVV